MLFLVVGVVAAMMIGFSLILRFIGWLCYGNDPDYRQFRKSGGDPYFDLALPEGINNDSWAVRCGGKPEPRTSFVPPLNWLTQCNACGAGNLAAQGACWHCGNGLSNNP